MCHACQWLPRLRILQRQHWSGCGLSSVTAFGGHFSFRTEGIGDIGCGGKAQFSNLNEVLYPRHIGLVRNNGVGKSVSTHWLIGGAKSSGGCQSNCRMKQSHFGVVEQDRGGLGGTDASITEHNHKFHPGTIDKVI